jgi:putative PIN family toxin of toxin-antitoxin system
MNSPPRPVIVDTNVVVSGLLTGDPNAPTARILNGMLAADFSYVVSTELLAEYHTVLSRSVLRRLHGLSANELETVLAALAEFAIVLEPGPGRAAPDPNDQMLWDLLATRSDIDWVTGDQRLFDNSAYAQRLITPRAYADALSDS